MNSTEREAYWKVLCSLQGKNIEHDRDQLSAVTKLPPYLYRYRPVSVSSIDALQTNHLYFSKAYYYDDPFDTFIKIDYAKVNERLLDILQSPELLAQFHQYCDQLGISSDTQQAASSFLQSLNPDDLISGIINTIKTEIQPILKKSIWSVCFSESGINETMWLKYADQYKGFCLVYDVSDDTKWLCGKQEKCQQCIVNKAGRSLYPMYYSDEGYDATEYAGNIALSIAAYKVLPPENARQFVNSLPFMPWQAERISLIKSKCHEYDKEWRMILNGYANGPVMQEWLPYGVILGLRISESDREIIVRSARIAGIGHIFESYINNDNRLDIKEII